MKDFLELPIGVFVDSISKHKIPRTLSDKEITSWDFGSLQSFFMHPSPLYRFRGISTKEKREHYAFTV